MKKIILMLSLMVLVTAPVYGATQSNDLLVVCPEDGPECNMTPFPTDNLFYETNILPGDTFNQTLRVTNEDPDYPCNLLVAVTDHSESYAGFAAQLFTAINREGIDIYGIHDSSTTASNDKSLNSLYGDAGIDMGQVPANSSIDYDWTVTFDPSTGNVFQQRQTVFDFEVRFYCGQETTEALFLSKTNDATGDKLPGDQVIFTLELTAQDPVDGVVVTDLPADGFKYVPGSWTASSSVRGDISSLGEPTYASPGDWQVGDMIDGEIVTLTYETIIADEQQAGLYKDNAWAVGTNDNSEEVLANVNTGVFVGTQVNVIRSLQSEATFGGGQVLGASTELPATGATTLLTIIGLLLFAGGITIIIASYRVRQHA